MAAGGGDGTRLAGRGDRASRRLTGLPDGRSNAEPNEASDERSNGRRRHPSVLAGAPNLRPIEQAMVALRDDLGFETISLFVRGANCWKLLERHGPVRPWHSVLDPGVLEGTPETAEYSDVRAIPGAGPRLADLGCTSVSTLPLPDGGRIILDSAIPSPAGGWIERATPYLHLLAVMAGPYWSTGGAIRGYDEWATLQRMFTACEEILEDPEATEEALVAAAREALLAEEAYLISNGGDELTVVSDPPSDWPRSVPKRATLHSIVKDEPALDPATLQRLAVELSASSRALGGAYGGTGSHPSIFIAGWAVGPALSPISMAATARFVSTARTVLLSREKAVTSQMDRERVRMASALHDGLTQTVAGAVLELEAMHRLIERDPAEALATLDRSKREIRLALAELRHVLFDLSQTGDERKPAQSLTSYVEDVVRRWRLPARLAVEGDLSTVPERTLSVAYVVIREALANAAKHAAARNVTVRLVATDTDLVVTVGDGGPGFSRHDEDAAREAHHVGLDLLRRRVREAGGRLRIESNPKKGTRVIARLPIHRVAS